jgi:predicted DNA-binding ribbon-helix-helix protein
MADDDRILKRSVRIQSHQTSVSMENAFWQALQAIAQAQGRPLSSLIADVDAQRTVQAGGNLSSLLRVYALRYYQQALADHEAS